MMRTVLAGLAGGVAMFAWAFVAHMFLGLGEEGISTIADEQPVIESLQSALGDTAGMYFFPGPDPGKEMDIEAHDAKLKTSPSGIIIYAPPGRDGLFPQHLAIEFATNIVAAFLARSSSPRRR